MAFAAHRASCNEWNRGLWKRSVVAGDECNSPEDNLDSLDCISGAWLERLAGKGFHGDSAQSLPADDKWFRVFRAAGSPPDSQTSDSRGTCQSAALEMTLMFLRYAKIAYNAVRYLTKDTPPDPARKPVYAVVIPNVNRQLIDILSTLVFMLDDLVPRHNWYERSGYRGTGGHDLR
jgi:hypothetical protein